MPKQEADTGWGSDLWIDKLLYTRKSMWSEETIDRLASWMDLRPGLTVVDVGCGLGYLGFTYWQHFGDGGRYHGVDGALEMTQKAAQGASRWAVGGQASFAAGDAYQLPLTDRCADVVMCQAVLMHLDKPGPGLREMIRVAKPGGLIVCKEQDEFSALMSTGYYSVPKIDIKEQLLLFKGTLLYRKGREKLGWGDHSIAPKLATMMRGQGLIDVAVRTNDQPFFLEPPYEGRVQKDQFEKASRFWGDEEAYGRWVKREEEAFLAGGGSPEEYTRYREVAGRRAAEIRRQMKDGIFSTCTVSHFYVVKGRKPR